MNDGDFIRIDYEMSVGEDRKLVSTNKEDLAKQNNIYDEHMKYKDAVVIVGSEGLFKELNDSFKNAEVGKEVEVRIEPENAYGLRDPKNVKVHNIREFQRLNIEPEVGKEVTINNRRGRIISVTPGRVLVDYNHQWAGKPVFYKYTVKGVITDDTEKVKAIIDMYYSIDSSEFGVSVTDREIRIRIPENSKFDAAWIEAKFRIVSDLRKYEKGKDIVIEEFYEAQKEEPKEEKKEEAQEKPQEESTEANAAGQ
ncbi:peptidyl-prolyl cis-trans isomerase [Thermogymnomonas acidicola]|uniref:peptidylprolyl isomerase n=1 Tax=Thermogymnomonas acidicola TaxID=399579 RepID=A0AA37BRZ9_9ARCH|nr:peptidylprolyl isomerase [Thermogymnomonas acidicola]GGM73144.1 peptidyl-prolyl cis-trans isomerase [Thermogymnomonas acidicola]